MIDDDDSDNVDTLRVPILNESNIEEKVNLILEIHNQKEKLWQ
jgi:hypothetical protein